MLYKILGLTIIVAAGAIAFFTFQNEFSSSAKKETKTKAAACVQLTPAEQLAKMINDDFDSLAQTQQLPAEWNSIATVEIRMSSELARMILGKQRPNFQRVQDGKNYLELEFMDLPDEENPGLIVQASLFDIKSRNKIFEIGRTYTMNELNKISPPPQANSAPEKKSAQSPDETPATNASPASSTQGARNQ